MKDKKSSKRLGEGGTQTLADQNDNMNNVV
jgi:hypothetical protein